MGRNTFTPRCKNAKVYFRIFPTANMRWEHVKILEDMKTLYVRYLQDFGVGRGGCEPSYWKFETDGIFYNDTQEEIYNTTMAGVLEKVVEGCSAIILAFGQTGSGKSLTINGLQNSFRDRGIAPRVISDLFEKKASIKHLFKMGIEMSYIETHKMYVNDLLNPTGDKLDSQALKNVKVVKTKDEHSAMKTLFKAEGRREFSEDYTIKHAANGVLTLHVTLKPHNQTEPIKKVAKIHIVDLAGVDTFGNLTSIHKDVNQVGNANLARSQLEQFILILCENVPGHVLGKQRLNILIQYLGEALSAHSILRFIGHLRTNKENLLISLSMLRFGQIVRGMKPQKLQFDIKENKDLKQKKLEQELAEIKKMQDLSIMLSNGDLSTNINQERIKHMQHVAEEYLHNKTDEIVLLNVTDATTVLKVFKDLYNKLEAEKIECTRIAYEKAYEDALMCVKKVSSKADSVQSMKSSKKGSRKSIKSHEGSLDEKVIPKSVKKPPKGSLTRPISSSVDGQSSTKLKTHDKTVPVKPLKHSRTSSLNIMKKSSASRRKSNSSTATAGTGIDSIIEETALPDNIPIHNEAWNLFITDSAYNYKELINTVNKYEEAAKEVHRDYLLEVKNLQKLLEAVDIRKSEYQKAQMQRLLRKEIQDEDGNVIVSDLENVCLENLKIAHNELVKQQEKVLKIQTELRIALEACQNGKKTISDQYELFCQQKFQTSVPDLEAISLQAVEESLEISAVNAGEEEVEVCAAEKNHDIIRYENLKQIMKTQIQRKIYTREKAKKWVQSCKT
ncbi:hypothetical protein ILUMI_06737 [Ignelater luminosus]|uniref:Kinesin motor domain-containing protein n=1 Tax=Ignelater luminosus TaxID=2038154 RepID=A0A8K0D8P8_IGNLU|nr:hypothetical protein ILUMI_06737 [Ignelater luminosus]